MRGPKRRINKAASAADEAYFGLVQGQIEHDLFKQRRVMKVANVFI